MDFRGYFSDPSHKFGLRKFRSSNRPSDIIVSMSLTSAPPARASMVLVLSTLAACGGAATSAEPTTSTARAAEIRFTLRPSAENPTQVAVEGCYEGIPLSPTPPLPNVHDVVPADGGEALLVSPEGSVDLRPLESGDCVRYQVDLSADQQLSFGGAELGYWLGPPSLVLLVPHTAPRATPVSIRMELPSGQVPFASFDGPADAASGLRTEVSAIRAAALVGWGHGFGQGSASAGGAALDWTLLPGSAWSIEAVSGWLGDAARGASAVLGRFPYAALSMVVVAVDDAPSPVVFDYLVPGSGGVVLVRVDRTLEPGILREHPAALLEMLRLGTPVMTDDLWLTEGFLAYYREIVAVRLGYQRERDAYRHLHLMLGSFQARRDRPSADDGAGLLPDVPSVAKGVALALAADVAFRATGSSLDARMAAAFGEASQRNAMHTADEVIAALDAGLEAPVVAPLARAIRRGGGEDVVQDAYRALAMTPGRRGRLELRGGRAAGAELRAAITAPTPSEEAVAEAP
jgi:hypothetical protein